MLILITSALQMRMDKENPPKIYCWRAQALPVDRREPRYTTYPSNTKKRFDFSNLLDFERKTGLGPATLTLARLCSTN